MTQEDSKNSDKPLRPAESSGWSALKALVEGFATTAKHLARKPITESYPEFKTGTARTLAGAHRTDP